MLWEDGIIDIYIFRMKIRLGNSRRSPSIDDAYTAAIFANFCVGRSGL